MDRGPTCFCTRAIVALTAFTWRLGTSTISTSYSPQLPDRPLRHPPPLPRSPSAPSPQQVPPQQASASTRGCTASRTVTRLGKRTTPLSARSSTRPRRLFEEGESCQKQNSKQRSSVFVRLLRKRRTR